MIAVVVGYALVVGFAPVADWFLAHGLWMLVPARLPAGLRVEDGWDLSDLQHWLLYVAFCLLAATAGGRAPAALLLVKPAAVWAHYVLVSWTLPDFLPLIDPWPSAERLAYWAVVGGTASGLAVAARDWRASRALRRPPAPGTPRTYRATATQALSAAVHAHPDLARRVVRLAAPATPPGLDTATVVRHAVEARRLHLLAATGSTLAAAVAVFLTAPVAWFLAVSVQYLYHRERTKRARAALVAPPGQPGPVTLHSGGKPVPGWCAPPAGTPADSGPPVARLAEDTVAAHSALWGGHVTTSTVAKRTAGDQGPRVVATCSVAVPLRPDLLPRHLAGRTPGRALLVSLGTALPSTFAAPFALLSHLGDRFRRGAVPLRDLAAGTGFDDPAQERDAAAALEAAKAPVRAALAG